jgi:perosamine synthetase
MSTATTPAPQRPVTQPTPPAKPAIPDSDSKLAIYGGPRAVTARYRERWKNSRIRDLLPMLRHLVVGRSTQVRGPMLLGFESRFASFVGSRYALMTNSGTAALHSAYFAVGVRPGDEVIVPTYTFFASAAPVLQCGATPVFCDVDERTLTADPDDVERRITPRTRAICVVHVWGNPARLDRFVEIARRHHVALIEDASHAHGATYQGRPVGSWGDVGAFSLQGSKAISGGEAGIIVTSNADYYDRMLALGHNGREEDHVTGRYAVGSMNLGLKYRPHMAAIALASGGLKRIGELNRLRRRNYAILAEELEGCEAVRPIETYPGAERGGLLEFIVRFRPKYAGGWSREAFVAAARAEGVQVAPDRYTCVDQAGRLLHEAPLFNEVLQNDWGGVLSSVRRSSPPRETRLPVAETLADELLTLPPFTKVDEAYIRQTARALRKVTEGAAGMKDLRAGG